MGKFMFNRSMLMSALKSGVAVPSLALAILAGPGNAGAQEQATEDQQALDRDIVVTGTLVRGARPVGSNAISVGQAEAKEQGATTANELLATIPQVTNLFNNVPSSYLSIAQNQIQVVRPNLRNLSPNTGSSASTLVLFDGHRVAGVGVTQSSVDPDLIPTGAIERVDVVTDGGSATYGADAVGGVINFITRKRFDGLKLDIRRGFADDYRTLDINTTAGKDWGTGSLFVSYMHQQNDAIFGRDRDYIRQVDYNTANQTPMGRQCSPGNVSVPGPVVFTIPGVITIFGPGANYAIPNLATPGVNACDPSDDKSFVPSARRNSAIAGLHQELNDAITIDLRAFYGERRTKSYNVMRGDATVTPTNAFYRPASANPAANQTVAFSFAPVLGSESAPSGTSFEEWGANAEIAADITSNWQLRTLLNYSRSSSNYYIAGLNQTLLAAAGSASDPSAAVNFYDPASTPNLGVIRAIADSETAGQSKDELINARAIVDGVLATLPGGDIRLALGYEFMHDNFQQRVAPANAVRGAVNRVGYVPYTRTVHSAFGELQVPLVAEANRMGLIYSLDLAGSIRYDDFSDFGSTTNFKLGATYKPVRWLGLRGNYSTSFNAPSPVDQLGSLRNTISFFPFNAFVRPGDTPVASGTLALQGSTPNLKPQTAKTYSFGADIDPFDGFHASVNYYRVKFKNLLNIPTSNPAIFTNFPNNVVTNVNGLTADQIRAFGQLAPNGAAVVEPLIAAGRPVYETVNFLVGNYGDLNVSGLDFAANYQHATGFGGIDAAVSGNYTLTRKSKVSPASPEVNLLDTDSSRLQLQASIGADVGRFRAQATLNHNSGYDVTRSSALPQDHVGSFNTVNLYFKYDVPGDSWALKDLSFTVNVNNVLDTDPPLYLSSADNGFVNGFTVGRLVMLGVSKKF